MDENEQGGPENVQPRIVTLFVLSKCCKQEQNRLRQRSEYKAKIQLPGQARDKYP